MTVQFEAQLSHIRTAFLWDLGLNMQPCLTSSALLSMAASAASLLASSTHPASSSWTPVNTALLNTVALGPLHLPSVSQMTQKPSCCTLQLSVAVVTGSLSISCDGANQMQSFIAQTVTSGSYARAALKGPADSPGALACILSLPFVGQHVARPAAALAHVASQAHDESGYSLHPAVFEMPVSLAALAAQQGKAQPMWLQSAAATLLPAASATAGVVALDAPSSSKAWSTDQQEIVQQEGTVFASGLALTAAEPSEEQAAAAAAVGDVTNNQEADDQLVSADSALLQMDSQERKLYIQAQVCTDSLWTRCHLHCVLCFKLL